jgi:hypothetical protein
LPHSVSSSPAKRYGYDTRVACYDKDRAIVPFDPTENGRWLENTKKDRDRDLARRQNFTETTT